VLIQKALGTPFIPFADNLFNDSAIAMPTPMDEKIPSQTISTAMRHGWNGRSRSRAVTGTLTCTAPRSARRTRRSASCARAWVARFEHRGTAPQDEDGPLPPGIGTGTASPWGYRRASSSRLEATALLFNQRTATAFVEFFEAGDMSERAQERFNQRLNEHFEGTRDYIVTHYKTNSRTDTEYWRANAANMTCRLAEAALFDVDAGKSIAADVGRRRSARAIRLFVVFHHVRDGLFRRRRT